MSRDTDVEFELRSGDGVTVLEAGWRTKEGEIVPNRSLAQRLYERRPGMALLEEIGAHAQGAVATERPNLKAEDLNIAMENMSQCACGKMVEGGVCGCTDDAKIDQIVEQVKKMVFTEEPPKPLTMKTQPSEMAWNSPPARQLQFDKMGAPGEYGQYKALSPEPISIIHSWGMGFNEGSMLEKLARWQTMHNILDLEKLVWFAVDLLEQERIKQNNL